MTVAARFGVIAVLALQLAGCGERGAAPTPPDATRRASAASTQHGAADGIAWFDGDVDAAFTVARRKSQPVLLYWGAVWCPPCQQLKSSVFTRRDFIEKSRLFVPVYLDGDSAGAQRQGEAFGVIGYPTVVILSPGRREILRLSGGMDLAQYAQMLDLALGDLQPIDTLLAALPRSSEALPAAVCRRLAWNGWVLDEHAASEAAALSRQIAAAAAHCGSAPAVEHARLVGSAAYFAGVAEEADIVAGRPASEWLVGRVHALYAALADPALASGVVDVLQWQGEPVFAAARQAGLGEALLARLDVLLERAASSVSLDDASRLDAWGARLVLHRALDPDREADATLTAAALERVHAALAVERVPLARAGVVNAALGIYDALDRHTEARALVAAEIERSATPYYYLADLAAIDEELGDKPAALASYERAWRESRGAATRVQWGTMYLSALLRLAPADAARIRAAGLAVLGEAGDAAALYQRTQRRLERLDEALRRWNADGRHAAVIASLRERLRQGCGRDGVEPDVRRRCAAFLAGA